MKFEIAGLEPLPDAIKHVFRLTSALAMKHGVIGVSGEPNAGKMPRHPEIERIVQEQIGPDRRNDAALRRALVARLKLPFRVSGHGRFLPVARLISCGRQMTPSLRSSAIAAVSTLLRTAPSLDGASLLSASPFGLGPFAWHRRRRFPQFNSSFGRSAPKLRRTRSLAGWWSLACRVVTGALLRRLTPAIPAARISRAIRLRPTKRPSACSLGRERVARHRFHAIQRGSCGYDASDRRRRSPEPKRVGSARRNSRGR